MAMGLFFFAVEKVTLLSEQSALDITPRGDTNTTRAT